MDDNVFLIIVECESYCGCGGQCVSCIVCHKVYTGERNLEVVGALLHSSVCNCFRELQHDHIQHQDMTFHKHM